MSVWPGRMLFAGTGILHLFYDKVRLSYAPVLCIAQPDIFVVFTEACIINADRLLPGCSRTNIKQV